MIVEWIILVGSGVGLKNSENKSKNLCFQNPQTISEAWQVKYMYREVYGRNSWNFNSADAEQIRWEIVYGLPQLETHLRTLRIGSWAELSPTIIVPKGMPQCLWP